MFMGHYEHTIDEKGRIAHIFPKVKVIGHAKQILEVLS